MKYFMTFSYDGSKYNGYQKQTKNKTIVECYLINIILALKVGKPVENK